MVSPEARELALFIENDADLYRQQYSPIQKNLARKIVKGVFQKALALKLIVYLVENGRKKYAKEFGDVWGGQRVSNAQKLEVARELYPGIIEGARDLAREMKKARLKKTRCKR